MIKGIGITIIIDEIKSETTSGLVKDNLLNAFHETAVLQSAEKYSKFPDAYKLEYFVSLSDIHTKEKLVYQMLLLAESIASPWLVYFDSEGNNTELLFNRDINTQTTNAIFSHIRWAHIQLIY